MKDITENPIYNPLTLEREVISIITNWFEAEKGGMLTLVITQLEKSGNIWWKLLIVPSHYAHQLEIILRNPCTLPMVLF
jgi:hypothetical protein